MGVTTDIHETLGGNLVSNSSFILAVTVGLISVLSTVPTPTIPSIALSCHASSTSCPSKWRLPPQRHQYVSASSSSTALAELQAQLSDTQMSLTIHVDEIHYIGCGKSSPFASSTPSPSRQYILVTIASKTTTTSESPPTYASKLSSAPNLLFSLRDQQHHRLGHLQTYPHPNRRTKGLWI